MYTYVAVRYFVLKHVNLSLSERELLTRVGLAISCFSHEEL